MGSPTRLGGIKLYHDFEWFDHFPSRRAQFQNGQCLARLVKEDCPVGLTPALLLTTRDDVEEGAIEAGSEYIVVVNLPRYLAQATPDAAASYYARRLGSGLTAMHQLHELAAQPEVIEAVVGRELTETHIAEWASGHEERIEQLRRIAGTDRTDLPVADPAAAIAALQSLASLDPQVVEAIEGLFGQDIDREVVLRFLRALTNDPMGRYVASEVLGQRIAERLADVRNVATAYSALLASVTSGETDLQEFIERNPWLLGLEYVGVRPRRVLPRGEMDFILERYDGFHDLLELKNPQDPIITAPDLVDGVPPSASAFALSPDLAQALAQVHVYRDILSTDAGIIDRQYGLRETRDPRVFIVIGQSGALPPHRARVLRDLNLTLHRMEVLPYDVLAVRAETVLNNVELHLTASLGEQPEAQET